MKSRVEYSGTGRRRQQSDGFTMVELLVVIGIITVLIAMLLPMAQKVRSHAKGLVCSSNLRQIYISLVAYAQDHNDHWPSKEAIGTVGFRAAPGYNAVGSDWDGGKSVGPEEYGLPALMAQLKYIPAGSKVWVCPSHPEMYQQWGNTYSYSVAKAVVEGTSIVRAKNPDTMVLWDNYSFYPYYTGVPHNTAGSQKRLDGPANSNYPHRLSVQARKGLSLRSYQLLQMDGTTLLKAN